MSTQYRKFSKLSRLLDQLADERGISPHHLRDMPEVLEEFGLGPEDLSDEIIREARAYHVRQMRDIAHRHGGTYST